MIYDCVIVGGGIAGLQAAIQLGRYRHHVAVIDAGDGRSSICKNYHNIIGFPHGISGAELLASGKSLAEQLGTAFVKTKVVGAERSGDVWKLTTSDKQCFQGKRLLLATGVKDRIPGFPMLIPCMGISVFVCPDCDGYEVSGKPTLVLGSGNSGARMALTLTHWTSELIYVNHELTRIDDTLRVQLEEKGIQCIVKSVREVMLEEEQFKGIVLDDGSMINRSHCFIAFGGNEVRSSLARQLGVELMDNNHIHVDPRTKQTNVKHVWAAGDVTGHSEMATIAMGDGSQAAIWIHKSLITT